MLRIGAKHPQEEEEARVSHEEPLHGLMRTMDAGTETRMPRRTRRGLWGFQVRLKCARATRFGAPQRSHAAYGIIPVLTTHDSKYTDNPEHLGLLARSSLTRIWARALGAADRWDREMPFAVVEDLGGANPLAPALGRSRSPTVVPLLAQLHHLQPPRRARLKRLSAIPLQPLWLAVLQLASSHGCARPEAEAMSYATCPRASPASRTTLQGNKIGNRPTYERYRTSNKPRTTICTTCRSSRSVLPQSESVLPQQQL